MAKEELYVSINPAVYRKNKSNILLSQVDILQIAKKFHNLKVLAGQKYDLKQQLQKLVISALSQLAQTQEKMPKPKIPKRIQNHPEVKTVKEFLPSKQDEIENELKYIQEKLRKLNA